MKTAYFGVFERTTPPRVGYFTHVIRKRKLCFRTPGIDCSFFFEIFCAFEKKSSVVTQNYYSSGTIRREGTARAPLEM